MAVVLETGAKMNTQVIEYSKAIHYKYVLFFLPDSPDLLRPEQKEMGSWGSSAEKRNSDYTLSECFWL